MSYTPIRNKVLISARQADKVTSSGIILKVAIEPDLGVCEAVGPDCREVSKGDVVYLDWNAATKIDGEELWMISEDNILFIKE